MRERAIAVGLIISGGLVGIIVTVLILQVAAIPIARGVDISLAQARALADTAVTTVDNLSRDTWWRGGWTYEEPTK